MSTGSEEEDELDERPPQSEKGEGDVISYKDFQQEEVIIPKSLTFKEASSSLHMLGKDESGMRYAYLMITCTDNKLTEIGVVLQFVHVLFLDFSGNKLNLESLNVLDRMPYLLFLKVDRNIVESLCLNACNLLQILNLSRNKIINTMGLKQPKLECLDLNYNYIDEITFISEDIPCLKLLELRGNLLITLRGIYPTSLDSLYLAQNRIQTIDYSTLEPLVNLRVLHLRENLIHKLDGFPPLRRLKYLNLRRNNITKFRQFRKLQILPVLETLIVSQNPVCGDEEHAGEGGEKEMEEEEMEGEEEEKVDPFRLSVLVLLPNLRRINKLAVTAHERVSAELQQDIRFMEIMDEASSVEGGDVEIYGESEMGIE